jgi:hypothetical protein
MVASQESARQGSSVAKTRARCKHRMWTMKNSHQHWRALELHIPINGNSDPWVAGRKWPNISAQLMRLLPPKAGVKGEILGGTSDADGSPIELCGHFQYEDLVAAVRAFESIWAQAEFPNGTKLIHVERFPDCTFKFHVLIRWIDGNLDPFSTELTDAVLLGPHNS